MAYSITSGVMPLLGQLGTYYFYPWGCRWLRLALPAQKGTDVWLFERWLNRVHNLHPGWALERVPETGVLTRQVMLQIRSLAKRLLIWQPWQVNELTYSFFGLDVDQKVTQGRLFGLRPLLVGDAGHDVWVLQNRLVSSNRRMALILGRPADGIYDLRTARLVRTFQRESQALFPGIRASGQVFGDTMLAVWDRTVLGGRTLAPGCRGLDVLALQDLLTGFGFPCNPCGIFDRQTAERLAAWQRANGLSVSGVFSGRDFWHLGLLRGY